MLYFLCHIHVWMCVLQSLLTQRHAPKKGGAVAEKTIKAPWNFNACNDVNAEQLSTRHWNQTIRAAFPVHAVYASLSLFRERERKRIASSPSRSRVSWVDYDFFVYRYITFLTYTKYFEYRVDPSCVFFSFLTFLYIVCS